MLDFAASRPGPSRYVHLLAVYARIAERPAAYQHREDLPEGVRGAVNGCSLIPFTPEADGVIIERVLPGARPTAQADLRGARSVAWESASTRLPSSAIPLPAMSKAVP